MEKQPKKKRFGVAMELQQNEAKQEKFKTLSQVLQSERENKEQGGADEGGGAGVLRDLKEHEDGEGAAGKRVDHRPADQGEVRGPALL